MGGRAETYDTPFGVGSLVTWDGLPVGVRLPSPHCVPVDSPAEPSIWADLLERYFAGEVVDFPVAADAYVEHTGLSDFARDVLTALSRVPYGTVVSYRDLAAASGHPSAHRATGSIMAANNLPILLPCHRVVHSDGRLGRYNGDPGWKARLLRLEGVWTDGEKLT